MALNRRVVVSGLGIISPLGCNVQQVWDRLLSGQTAIRALKPEDLPEYHQNIYDQLSSKVVGCVDKEEFDNLGLIQKEDKKWPSVIKYALAASQQALLDAKWQSQNPEDCENTGVSIGNGMSGTQDISLACNLVAERKVRKISPYLIPRILPNMAAGIVAKRYGYQGPNTSCSTACATGLHAIGDAYHAVQRGDAEVMVAGATESCIDAISLGGFASARALSTKYNDAPEVASRPFDSGRDGFVLAEGAGIVILEEEQHAVNRGANIYAEVCGYGRSGDAYHITEPSPDGKGATLAMQRSFRDNLIAKADVGYVNAHATSTPKGDTAEQIALSTVFGERVTNESNSSPVFVSSTKGATGHLLGAAGAVETIFTILAVHTGICPPSINFFEGETICKTILKEKQQLKKAGAMCNSFGFGGTNACLLIKKYDSNR